MMTIYAGDQSLRLIYDLSLLVAHHIYIYMLESIFIIFSRDFVIVVHMNV